jgi:hypothetical protein
MIFDALMRYPETTQAKKGKNQKGPLSSGFRTKPRPGF